MVKCLSWEKKYVFKNVGHRTTWFAPCELMNLSIKAELFHSTLSKHWIPSLSVCNWILFSPLTFQCNYESVIILRLENIWKISICIFCDWRVRCDMKHLSSCEPDKENKHERELKLKGKKYQKSTPLWRGVFVSKATLH